MNNLQKLKNNFSIEMSLHKRIILYIIYIQNVSTQNWQSKFNKSIFTKFSNKIYTENGLKTNNFAIKINKKTEYNSTLIYLFQPIFIYCNCFRASYCTTLKRSVFLSIKKKISKLNIFFALPIILMENILGYAIK